MATGQNLQPNRGAVTSDVTPSASLGTGETEMWQAASRLADQVNELAAPIVRRKAEEIGKREGAAAAAETAAGRPAAMPRSLLPFGDAFEARTAAAGAAYQAGVRSDFDAREAQARINNPANVEGYEREMSAIRSTFIQNAEPEYAVDVEQYAINRVTLGRTDVAQAASNVRLREEAATLSGRMSALGRQMADELSESGTQTVKFEILRAEYEDVRDMRLSNPAIPYSETEAEEDRRELEVAQKAAIYTRFARDQLRTEGAPAALASLQGILMDDAIDESERAVVFQRVRETINQEIDLITDRANMARSAQTRREEAMTKRIEDSAAAIEVGAEDTGLTEAEVMATLGPSGVAEFHRKRAEASERNRLTGSLVGLPPEEALRRARTALSGGEGTTLEDLGNPLDSPEDLDAFAAAIRQVETGNNPARISADPDGAGPAGGGAIGAMQLKPGTARAAAARLGIPYDERRLLTDVAYNESLGREEVRHLLSQFDGDARLAATAYFAGAGNVAAWLKPVGTQTRVGDNTVIGKGDPRTGEISYQQWLDRVRDAGNPRSAEYANKVAEALGTGRNTAAWRETQARTIVTNATEGFASDPINFAFTRRLVGRVDLPVDGVFQPLPAAQAQWREALAARATVGRDLAARYQTPQRFFTQAEVTAYRDRFERNPGAAVEFAQQAVLALGGRGARDALREVGQGNNAPTAIHIGTLAASGGSATFADSAAQGLTLKASGEALENDRRTAIMAEIDNASAPFAANPSLLQAVRNTAEAAAVADKVAGISTRSPEYYAQSAMGRTNLNGRLYGGVEEINGRDVLLPTWLNPSRADDAFDAMANSWATNGNGPVYSSGAPMPARDVSALRMQVQPNGRYRLLDRNGRVAVHRNGSPFEVDFEAARPFLESELGVEGVKPD